MKKSKKFFSMLMATALFTVCSNIVCFAATEHSLRNLIIGTPYTFETGTGDVVVDSGDSSHGMVGLITLTNDILNLCDFKIEKTVAVVSFDIYATSGVNIKLEYTAKRSVDSGGWAHNKQWGRLVNSSLKNETDVLIGDSGSVTANQWHHFDLRMDLTGKGGDDVEVFLDGEFQYSFDANVVSEKEGSLTLGALKWRLFGGGGSGMFMVDNVYVREENSDAVEVEATCTDDMIELDFKNAPVNASEDTISVFVKDGPLSRDLVQVPITVDTGDGYKVKLLLSDHEQGTFYVIKLENVKSWDKIFNDELIIGKSLSDSVVVDKIEFANGLGEKYKVDNIASTATKMYISFPAGVSDADSVASLISVVESESSETMNFIGSWDNSNMVYVVTFDKPLGVSKTYDISISGVTAANGKNYDSVAEQITTSSTAETILANISFNAVEDGVSVSYYGVNTNDTESKLAVWAGYDINGNLVNMNFEQLTLTKDTAGQGDVTISVDDKTGVVSERVWIWNGFNDIFPLVKSVRTTN